MNPDWETLRRLPLADWRPRSQLRAVADRRRASGGARGRRPQPPRPVADRRATGRPAGWMIDDPGALVATMDDCGVSTVVNLDGMWGAEVTANVERYDAAYPGRFVTFCQLDWRRLAEPDGVQVLQRSLEESRDRGARGLKVWKDLGLGVTDADGSLVQPGRPAGGRGGPARGRPRAAGADPHRRPDRVLHPARRAQRTARGAGPAPGLVVRRPRSASRRSTRCSTPTPRSCWPARRRGSSGRTRGARRRTSTASNGCWTPPRTTRSTSPAGWPSWAASRDGSPGSCATTPTRCCSAPTSSRPAPSSSGCTSGSSRPPTRASPTTPRTRCPARAAGRSPASTSNPTCCPRVYRDNARRFLGLGSSARARAAAPGVRR